MSLKTIRILSRTAFILYAVALTLKALATVLQRPLLNALYYGRLDDFSFVIPLPQILNALVLFAIALISMILINRIRSDQSSRKAVLILGIILGVHTILGFLESWLFSQYMARTWGENYIFAYSLLNSYISWLSILTTPAYFLMVLAMGGFCNRAGRLREEQERVFVPEATKWTQEAKYEN